MISCICPTYNRLPFYGRLLEECVYWFTRQDWPVNDRELIILNDCPGQILKCDATGVRVVNLPEKIPSLGEKYNELLRLATGEIILPWEDDDIALPHRISQCVRNLGGFQYYNPQASWYEEGGRLHSEHKHGVCHNSSAFRAGLLTYPPVSGAQDAIMDAWCKKNLRCSKVTTPSPAEWDYVYRWGVSNYHLSGFHDTEKAWKAKQAIIPGTYRIEPKMHRDYAAEIKSITG